jgi:hypothetical protein
MHLIPEYFMPVGELLYSVPLYIQSLRTMNTFEESCTQTFLILANTGTMPPATENERD